MSTDKNIEWKEIVATEEKPQIMVCKKCGKHHFHIINLMHTRYAQCGECKEMYKL